MSESLADLFVRLSADTKDFKGPIDAAAAAASAMAQTAVDAGQRFSYAAQQIIGKQDLANVALAKAQTVLAELTAAHEAGAVSANTLASAAQNVQAAFDKANPTLAEANHHAHEGEAGFGAMAEQLLKFGEALAVTEALKEFGVEALKAFGEIQKADIALTALTGSAGTSKEALEGLKSLAISDALSFPALVEAQVRMTSFGIATEQIPATLRAAADAAAATNKDFAGVADAIANMALSGTAGAKQLKALGLSAADLGEVMGVSVGEVKKAFKDYLDETQRAEVLSEAIFEKFGGTAEKTAKGLLGQWANVGTQLHFAFEEIGKGLEPVISQFLKLLNTEIIPFVRSLVDDFNELPTPIKDVAVVMVLIAGSLAPVTVGLAGVGLAISGLTAALPAVTGLLAAMGVELTGLSVAAGAAKVALLALEVVPLVALATSVGLLAKGLLELELAQRSLHETGAGLDETLEKLAKSLEKQGVDVRDLGVSYALGVITAQEYLKRMKEEAAAHGVVTGQTEAETAARKRSAAEVIAQAKALEAGKAAYQEMVDAELAFHNSVVDLYNTFPATYEKYVSRLDDGGKTAKASLGEIENALRKAASLAEGLRGQPLADLNVWIVALTKMQATAKQFADSDAFYTAAIKVAALVDKFPKQVEELGAMDAGLREFFDTMVKGAANAPEALNKIDVSVLAGKLLEEQKALDDSGKQLEKTFTHAWIEYESGIRKVLGITAEFRTELQKLDETPLRDRLPAEINTAYEAAQRLTAAFHDLGIDISGAGTKAIADFNLVLADSRTTLDQVEIAWSRVHGQIDQIGRNNLPLAIAEYQKFIGFLKEHGAAVGQLYSAEEKLLHLEIREKTERGESTTKEIIQLEQLRRKHEELITASQRWGQLYVTLLQNVDKAFQTVSHAIADNIVDGKNWGQVFQGVLKTIEKQILNDLIGTAFKALETAILKQTGLAATLGKVLGGIFGGGSVGGIPGQDAIGNAAASEAIGLGTKTATTAASAGGSVASSASGAVTSSLAAWVDVGVNALSGIVAGIQAARLNNLMAEVEESTRYAKGYLLGLNTIQLTYLPELRHLVDIWGAINQVRDKIGGNGVNVTINVSGSGNPDQVADSIVRKLKALSPVFAGI